MTIRSFVPALAATLALVAGAALALALVAGGTGVWAAGAGNHQDHDPAAPHSDDPAAAAHAATLGSGGHWPGSLGLRLRNCEAACSKKLETSKLGVEGLAMVPSVQDVVLAAAAGGAPGAG